MNKCNNYDIPCPYALVAWDELPYFGTQDQCDAWREKYRKEVLKKPQEPSETTGLEEKASEE